jgi:uncharacterized membrane protein YcaP (DUF421 family)
MKEIFFKDWDSLWQVALCCIIAFFTLFLFIRISGKRTLAKLNAFDFIVTVTLGSTLSSMILHKVTLAEGSLALIIIIVLQYALALLARSSKTLESVINSKPSLLFYNGVFMEDEMKREGITKDEILAEIRNFRLERIDKVRAVVLELNGEVSVIKKSSSLTGDTSLMDVEGI